MIIHMGWIGSPVPSSVLAAVDAVRATASDCSVVLHTDESAVPERWRSRLIPVMRSDVLRHAVLREHGGLWLDIDVRLLASPTTWAADWTTYTAVMYGGMIGTDIIYVPPKWDGWPVVESYLDAFFAAPITRVRLSGLASDMVEACRTQRPEAFTVLEDPNTFPASPQDQTAQSVVARGFDPASHPLPPRPGLGDMVAAGLSAIGITEARAQAIASAVGIKDCGCGKRKAAMNRAGTLLGLPPGSTASG